MVFKGEAMKIELTARQHLERRGAFFYIIAYSILFISSVTLQTIAGLEAREIIPGIVVNGSALALAFYVYYKKSRGDRIIIVPWILGFISVSAPLAVKYNYMIQGGWTYAVQSTNSTMGMIVFAAMLYLFYQPRLFKFFSVYAMGNWILFIYLAYKNGAELYFQSHINGVPITSGLIVYREVFVMLTVVVIFLITYRNIPDIIKYEERMELQTDQLKKNAEAQLSMTAIIKDKMNILFQKVNAQNDLISRFNQKMETQSASFAEMSATMEELAGSAEQIAFESVTQLDGNVKMESIIEEFKNIQVETKKNLEETYTDIQSVSDKSTTANEELMEVEKTVIAIKDQSGKIGETVNLIVDIADKINLLSLNASIEAARAGEAGRGFAVVADEIGKLAFQTQESIKEIEKVLSVSAKNTVDGVAVIQKTAEMMREMINHMKDSSSKVQTLQESIFIEEKYIKIIISQMKDNISLAKKIGTATDEQKVAVESTSQAIEHLIEILNEMVGELKDMSAAAHEIYENAVDLMTDTDRALKGEA